MMTRRNMTKLKDFEQSIRELIKNIGEDSERKGLTKTPERVAKTFEFLTQGYSKNIQEIVRGAIFEEKSKDMIIAKNIEIFSLCEHHLLPFFGKCHVGYVPDGRIIGISKIARIVDVFARRFQVQERL